MGDVNLFGETTFRNELKKFGIRADDRRRHFYAIGKTGMGKSEMLKNMAIQDIREGRGIGFVDPHGESAEALLEFVPESRIKDVVYVDPADTAFPIAFNVMESVDPTYRHLVASGLMSVFKKIWPDVWSARMEYILNNAILALLEYPDSTLLGINRMLSDVAYRQKVVEKVMDPVIKAFWVQEYARYTQRYEVEATAAIQNKVGQFISNPLIRNIVGQVKSNVNMRSLMDNQKILIINLSKGKIGEDNSRLLGAMLITKLQLAAMSRVDIPEQERKDFFLYIDEFQNFATESFVSILSEARKYRLALVLSHQYIAQLDETVRDAVFGNVGTIVSFRVGAEDAEWLEKEFTPDFLAVDFVNLDKYHIYVKLMIDGIAGHPFSARTVAPFLVPEKTFQGEIIQSSRQLYSSRQNIVEHDIAEWSGITIGESGSIELPAPPPAPLGSPQILYDAVCAKCKKPTKVVFPPDGKRPVYCKTCRKKIKQEQDLRAEGEVKRENSSVSVPMSKPSYAPSTSLRATEDKPSYAPSTSLRATEGKPASPTSGPSYAPSTSLRASAGKPASSTRFAETPAGQAGRATEDKPASPTASQGGPSYAKATEGKPSYAKATEGKPEDKKPVVFAKKPELVALASTQTSRPPHRNPALSLRDAVKKAPVMFHKGNKPPVQNQPLKEQQRQALKDALRDALQSTPKERPVQTPVAQPQTEQKSQGGELHPGETVYFKKDASQ